MKFRKKAIVIDAYQTKEEMDIPTLEGTMHASIGDWIITGVNGEQYPCKPDIFAKTYERVNEGTKMDFGMAIDKMRAGARVQREGWNGKGMFLYYIGADKYPAKTEIAKTIADDEGKVPYGAYVALKTVNGTVIPWTPNMLDMLATDWKEVED